MTDRLDKDVQRLVHMLEGIKRLEKLLAGMDQDGFLRDDRTQAAIAFHVSMVGEAAARISDSFRQAHPEIPWEKMRGMRNHLVHIFDYGQIDFGIVWEVAKESLPALEPAIRAALHTIPLPPDFTLPDV